MRGRLQFARNRAILDIPMSINGIILRFTSGLLRLSVDHETIKGSPKTGVRAYARTPVFGESFSFCEVLVIIPA